MIIPTEYQILHNTLTEKAEHYVKHQYQASGYIVLRGTSWNKSPAGKTICINGKLGIPDWFVYNPDDYFDYNFVEVKFTGDCIRNNQYNWMMQNPNVKFKVIFITEMN